MEENEKEPAERARLDKFTLFLGVVGIVGFSLAFALYRSNFGPDLSHASAEWSNFGSYFGGLLNPFISLLMLVAVLRTILLQREVLVQQDRMLKYQSDQTILLRKDSERAMIHARKTALMQLAGSVRDTHTREIEASRLMCADIVRNIISANSEDLLKLDATLGKLNDQIEALLSRRGKIEAAIFEFAVKDYNSISEVDSGFRNIFPNANWTS